MSIPVQEFRPDRVVQFDKLFDDEIESDPWIIFHGTSGACAESIESNGFDPNRSCVSRDKIERVVRLYEEINWCGDDPGGFCILKPFSFDHDFGSSVVSRMFFSESSTRALLYATRNFAGGEKLRSLRRALRDLERYVEDEDVREHHVGLMQKKVRELVRLNASSEMIEAARPNDVDLQWLRRQLDALADVRLAANAAYENYSIGVVFAVDARGIPLEILHDNSMMGIEVSDVISFEKIVAKVEIPRDFEYKDPATDIDKLIFRQENGLLPALSKVR